MLGDGVLRGRAALWLSAVILGVAPGARADLVVNGSMNGPTGEALTPAGWSGYTVETVAPGGLASTSAPGGTFALGIPASTDGGTFIMGTGPSGWPYPYGEYIEQTLHGLVPGATYTVQFEYANAGWYEGTSGYPSEVARGYFAVSVGSGVQASIVRTFDGFYYQTWYDETMYFTADAETELLHFEVRDFGQKTRMALDGVSVVEGGPTAAQATAWGALKNLFR